MPDVDALLKLAGEILRRQTPPLEKGVLKAFVQGFLDRAEAFLAAVARHGSPLYLVERSVLAERAGQFVEAFAGELGDTRVYFALKSNNHPEVARAFVEAGLGLDVSSGRELQVALDVDATSIIFSGPGKTDEELSAAVRHRDRTVVLLDSFGELERLQRIAAQAGATVRAGVRLTSDPRGPWRKFGIALENLGAFIARAESCRGVMLRGVQFHTSWNLSPTRQVDFIARLGAAIGALPAAQKKLIEFVDVGGGFWPAGGEWLQYAGTPEGRLRGAIDPGLVSTGGAHCLAGTAIESFARDIGRAVREHLLGHVGCALFLEPGRWLCHDGMHLLLTVVDKKADDLVITDGGTNAIGWERFETDYFPVINLTHPATTEHPCDVMGSLCTPHDFWGFTYFGRDIQPGDVLLIPTQGAYTYSLRQEFIKPLPKVVLTDKATVA